MIFMTKEQKQLGLALGLIFFVIFILNSFMVRSAGDDYVYSFMWEGHSMYEPLSADARRIAGPFAGGRGDEATGHRVLRFHLCHDLLDICGKRQMV